MGGITEPKIVQEPGVYGWIMLAGILLGAFLAHRRWRKSDPELFAIFVGALVGAFLGAKIIYFLAEGWTHIGTSRFWTEMGYGKTIIGALLGGYAAVEITKRLIGYDRPTGDWFAFMVPLGIAAGRIGCLRHGCCLGMECPAGVWYALADPNGVPRYPAVPVELLFNLLAIALLLPLRSVVLFRGQLFHLYLIGYGLFRTLHEFVRDTPKIIAGIFSGYQVAALALLIFAVLRFRERMRENLMEKAG